ncbi:MAG: NYN domain-containing protein, partial [Candidatus Aenigmatarchaeota archaeon]
MVLDKVKEKVKRGKKNRVGLFVDGPNIIRKEFNINLDKLRERVEGYGRIAIGKVFLNQFASEKLIEAI